MSKGLVKQGMPRYYRKNGGEKMAVEVRSHLGLTRENSLDVERYYIRLYENLKKENSDEALENIQIIGDEKNDSSKSSSGAK